MKFHRYVTALFGALALAFLATGCTIPVMATGKYAAEDSGREDYAVVYQDKIFLHIKAPELYTLPIGMLAFDSSQGQQTNLLMAAVTMSIVPMILIFLFMQKQLVKGIMLGGVKG